MRRKILVLLLSFALVLTLVPTVGFAADSLITLSTSPDSLENLKPGDVVEVKAILPSTTGNGFQFDIAFDSARFAYNNDADISAIQGKLPISKAGLSGDSLLRLVASALSGTTSFDAGTVALKATFTVKENAYGKSDAFQLTGFIAGNQSEDLGISTVIKKAEIKKTALTTVTVSVAQPVKNAALATTVDTNQETAYTAAVKWYEGNGTDGAEATGNAKADQVYTAKITLTADTDAGENFATGDAFKAPEGYTVVSNDGTTIVLTKTFGKTAKKALTGVEVTTQPTKTAYIHGDAFDPAGMVVKATYDDGSTDNDFKGYAVSYETEGKSYLQYGNTKVTVNAEGKSAEVTGITVAKKELQIEGLKATNRKYDATTEVALTGGTLTGVIDGEDVKAQMPTSGTAADANVGNGKAVTVAAPELTGADASCYTLKAITGITVDITEAEIPEAVANAITGYHGEYDAAAHPAVQIGDAAADYTVTFADAKDGTYSAVNPQVTDAADSKSVWVKIAKANYAEKIVCVEAKVDPKNLTAADLEYLGTITKEYDGTTACDVKAVTVKKAAAFNQDVTVTGGAVYDKKDTDAAKVTFTADGITEGNFRLAAGTTFEIAAAITATDKYSTDETKYHTQNVVKGVGTFEEPQFISDFKEAVKGTFRYLYESVEKTKDEIINALKDKDAGETASIDYTFTPADANFTGTKSGMIRVNMVDIEFKVGEETASADNAITVKTQAPVYGTKWSDIVELKQNMQASVGSRTVDGTYTLSVDPNSVPGVGKADYNVLFTSTDGQYRNVKVFTTDASINVAQKPLTVVGAKAANRQYDGTKTVAVTGGTLQGVVGEDAVTLNGAGTGTVETADAGADKAVTVSGYMITGTDAGNYTFTQPTDVTVTILKKELTLASAAVEDKVFDGTSGAAVTAVTFREEEPLPASTGYTAAAEFADANAAADKAVTVKVVLQDKNYNLAIDTIETTASITKAAAVTVPAQKISLKAGSKATQTVDLAKLMPKNAGTLTLEFGDVTDPKHILQELTLEDGKLSFELTDEANAEGMTAALKVTIKSDNYADTEVTVEVATIAKDVPKVTVEDITMVYSGNAVSKDCIKGTSDVEGSFDWAAGVNPPTNVAQSGNYDVTFTPQDTTYVAVTKTIQVTITPAKITGTLDFAKVTEAGKTLGEIKPTDFSKLSTAGTFAWNDGDAKVIEQGKAYGWTFTPDSDNYAVLTGTVTPWAAASSGGFIIPTDTPEKAAKDFIKDNLTVDDAAIKAADEANYTKILDAAGKYDKLSDAEKAAVDKELKAQTGKTMQELQAEAEKIKVSIDASAFDVQKAVKELTLKARSSKLKSKNTKVVVIGDLAEIEANGYVVKYKFYRSTKKSAGYKAMLTKSKASYINTTGKKGTMYYYKARVMVYDKDGNLAAKTELKQCKYANRLWVK